MTDVLVDNKTPYLAFVSAALGRKDIIGIAFSTVVCDKGLTFGHILHMLCWISTKLK